MHAPVDPRVMEVHDKSIFWGSHHAIEGFLMTTRATRERRLSAAWDHAITQTHPIFWPVRKFGRYFAESEQFPNVNEIDNVLARHARVRFREQVRVPKRSRHKTTTTPYDASILAGEVPTRDGSWHDFMNALVWAAFPTSKRVLHEQQHSFVAAERATGEPGRRFPAHDALAVLDEGGVIVVSPEALDDSRTADDAIASGAARALVFGHAIYEAIAIGGPWPIVRAVCLQVGRGVDDEALVSASDCALANYLRSAQRPTRPQDLPCISLAAVATLNAPNSHV